jgi:hypothetical protein
VASAEPLPHPFQGIRRFGSSEDPDGLEEELSDPKEELGLPEVVESADRMCPGDETEGEDVKEKRRIQVAVVIRHQDELLQPLKVLFSLGASPEKNLQGGPY